MTIYYTLSKVFPPTSTLVDRTVESLDDHQHQQDHELSYNDLQAWEKRDGSEDPLKTPNSKSGLV